MLTFEQLQPALHKWANHFRNRLFDHWELINAVWLNGKVQKLSDISLASNRIKFDMIDYIRSGSRAAKRQRSRGRFYPRMKNFSNLMRDEDSDIDFGARQEQPNLDRKDYFKWLLKNLNRDCKLIILLRYEAGYDFSEIAQIIGLDPSRICQLHKETLVRLRSKLIRAGEQKRLCNRKGRATRVDIDELRSYNRMYYMLNKARIQMRRKALRDQRKTG